MFPQLCKTGYSMWMCTYTLAMDLPIGLSTVHSLYSLAGSNRSSVKKTYHRLAQGTICWGHFLSCGFVFQNDSNVYLVDIKQISRPIFQFLHSFRLPAIFPEFRGGGINLLLELSTHLSLTLRTFSSGETELISIYWKEVSLNKSRVTFVYGCKHTKYLEARWYWHVPLISTLRRQKHMNLCEFKVSLVYKS